MNGVDDSGFGFLEGFVELGGPCELAACAKEGLEWCHCVAELCIVRYLVNETEPASDVCGGGGRREIPDGVQVFG